MTSGEIIGLDYRTDEPVRIAWRDGRIISVQAVDDIRRAGSSPCTASTSTPALPWLAPGLFDLQVNGYAGVDFQQDHLTEADVLQAARGLRRDGCTRFFFTLITAEWELLLERLRRARALRAASPQLLAAISGWHIEGPFLSPRPGFCGAHDAAVMRDPTPEYIRQLRAAAGSDPVLLTLAPERSGAVEVIRTAISLGIVVSLGHSDAPADVLRAAVNAGAKAFTHLSNGCARELDRHDNIIWRVCDTPGLTVSLIPDGLHVPPPVFRALHRLLDRVYYTTDAMAAAGAPPGRYRLGALELEVGADQVVRQPGQTNFAGSALCPIDAVFRAAKILQQPWQQCWTRLSEAPARLVGIPHGLYPGAPADFCILNVTESGDFQSLSIPG